MASHRPRRQRRRQHFTTTSSLSRRIPLLLFVVIILLLHSGVATSTTEELFGIASTSNNNEHDHDENDDADTSSATNTPDPSTKTTTTTTTTMKENKTKKVIGSWGSSGGSNNSSKTQQQQRHSPSLPFIKTIHHEPPSGFAIKARVYTSTTDTLAHIESNPTNCIIPYYDCGIDGETSHSIPLVAANWRHSRSKPSAFTTTPNDSPGKNDYHPQLVVCLSSSARLETTSGEWMDLQSGDVILLENVIGGGHKIYPTPPPTSSDAAEDSGAMTVLILTLPIHYHSIGKEKSCLTGILQDQQEQAEGACSSSTFAAGSRTEQDQQQQQQHVSVVGPRTQELFSFGPTSNKLRRWVRNWSLSAIGVSLSTVAITFLSKRTAIWLSITMGSVCTICASTYAFVQTCHAVMDKMELLHSEKVLKEALLYQDIDDDDDDDDDDEIVMDLNVEKPSLIETYVVMDDDNDDNKQVKRNDAVDVEQQQQQEPQLK